MGEYDGYRFYGQNELPQKGQPVIVYSNSTNTFIETKITDVVTDENALELKAKLLDVDSGFNQELHKDDVVVVYGQFRNRYIVLDKTWRKKFLRLKDPQRRLAAANAPVLNLAAPNLGLVSVTLAVGGCILFRAFRGCLRKRRPEYILPTHDEIALRFPVQ